MKYYDNTIWNVKFFLIYLVLKKLKNLYDNGDLILNKANLERLEEYLDKEKVLKIAK